MQTVILAGGIGKRVYPLNHKPKCLYKIMGKPIIDYVVNGLEEVGLRDLIFVVPEGDSKITEYLNKRDNLNIQYAYQREALGMGNAIGSAMGLLKEEFLVVNADDIYDPKLLEKFLDGYKKNHTGLTLAVKETETPWKFDIVEIDDKGVPKRVVEKPKKGEEPSNLAVIGVYLFNPEIFDFLAQVPISDHQLEDAYQKYMDREDAKVIEYDGYFGSFKYPWDILDVNKYLMQGNIKEQEIHPSVKFKDREKTSIEGNVKIEEGVKIFEYSIIRGPCYIGKNTIIGNYVLIRESSIGENCLIGAQTEIARSTVGDNSEFHQTYVGDSIIGERCWFSAGVITANLRLDRLPVKVRIDGQEISTGRDKLGVVTGNDVSLGTGIQLRPGTIIGSNVCIDQGLTVQGDIPSNKFVKNRKGGNVIADKND
jgi:bifunctional UDP-N-acetylglucosamine pyrophosphorylase/glucosamine-1-phosphate N-acetyltransferase